MPAAVLWGIGTAIGEVPPYLLARAAAQAGKARGRPSSARCACCALARRAGGAGGSRLAGPLTSRPPRPTHISSFR